MTYLSRSFKFAARKNRAWSRARIIRSSSGLGLIEMLAAVVFGAIIAGTLASLFAATMRNSTTDQNAQTANSIAEELIEYTRTFDYNTLSSMIGTYELLPTNNIVSRAPVVIDTVNKTWTPKSVASSFKGTVSYSIQAGSIPQSLLITILVGWTDSSNTSKQIITATVVTQNGANYWH